MKLSGKLYQTNSINFEIFCSIDLSFVPEGVETRPVDIEQLFLFMAREEDYR